MRTAVRARNRPMSPDTCNRVRDALAAGNVWGDTALMEHAKDCEVCASELAVLKKRREFRDAFPVLSSIADESKRPATEVRAQSNGSSRLASRRHLFIMIAAVVAIFGFIMRSRERTIVPEQDATPLTGPPRFRISNLENAVFESKVQGATVQSSMTQGVAAFHVERLGPQQRFHLTLPDGNVEVRGTRFVVTIEGGKTRGVDVAEGTVALRLHGRQEMILSAGQRWPGEASGRPTLFFMRQAPKDAAPAASAN
jgi:FecR protein